MLTKVTRNDLDDQVKNELDGLDTHIDTVEVKADQGLAENDAQDTKIAEIEADIVTINDVIVKSVEGILPDENGNVDLSSGTVAVTSVNNQLPDGLGNVVVDDTSIPVINPYTGTQSMLNVTLNQVKNVSVRSVDGQTPDANGNALSSVNSKKLNPGTDVNTLKKEGMYHSELNTDNCLNTPVASTAFSLLVEKHYGYKQTWTEYINTTALRVFVRNSTNTGEWGPWVQVLTATAGKASDSEKLDGKDSSEFLLVGGKAADSNLLDGKDSTAFLLVGGKAADSNLLDGINSSSFARLDTSAYQTFAGEAMFSKSIDIGVNDFGYSIDASGHIKQSNGNYYLESGYLYTGTNPENKTYYVKVGSHNYENSDPLSTYSTLRLGDVAILASDLSIQGNLPNIKQVSSSNFGVTPRLNEENESCIYLIDILERMQQRLDEQQEEINLLKGLS